VSFFDIKALDFVKDRILSVINGGEAKILN
jgi:hypothetical protein